MQSIDVILLGGLIASASWLIIKPKSPYRLLKPLVALTILLALAQLFIHGYYWHYVPAYLLLLLLIIRSLFPKRFSGNAPGRFLQLALVFFIAATILPWAVFLPVPKLIEPRGRYTVGTRIFRWVDIARAEQITQDTNDKRNVVVQAWYPTEENAKGPHAEYLDGLHQLPEKVGIIPAWVFDHYDEVNTYGVINAPISRAHGKWPAIIFLTGNGASRAFYTSMAAGLASYGYVVLAMDHPYEAMITQLANGRVVTTIEEHSSDDPDLLKFMENRLELRITDVKFVLNQLASTEGSSDNFLSAIDQSRIGIAGHSLGGASAAVAMAVDARIKAAANLDGTLYGELPEPNGARPYLLVESKKDLSDRFLRYENGNKRLFRLFGGGYRYEIPDADHYSFTDAPLLLALPARFIASRFLKFGNIPVKTQTATSEILITFFNGALNGKLSDLDSVANRYQGVIQKPIY